MTGGPLARGQELPKYCRHCKAELPPADRSTCVLCGTGQEASDQEYPDVSLEKYSPPADPPPPVYLVFLTRPKETSQTTPRATLRATLRERLRRLLAWRRHPERPRKLFTKEWVGRCPKCGKERTFTNTFCPVDATHVVVSFDELVRNPFSFPVRTAEMRCLGNCGVFGQRQLSCIDKTCDGIIAGRYLKFWFPWPRTCLYHAVRIPVLLFFICTQYQLWSIFLLGLLHLAAAPGYVVLAGFCWVVVTRIYVELPRYPMVIPLRFRGFTFNDVTRTAR